MRSTVIDAITSTGDTMAAAGYWDGVLAARWAEIAVEQAQETEAMRLYWQLRRMLGAD